ncbi:MAG: hypothetical protein WD229_07135, partial [Pirellulales bacterium]
MIVHYALFAVGALAMMFLLCAINRRESGGEYIATPLLLFCFHEATFVWPAAIFARIDGVSEDNYASLVILSSSFAFIAGYMLLRNNAAWATCGPLRFWSQPLVRPNEPAHLAAIILCATLFMLVGLYLFQGLPPALTGMHEFLRHGYATGANETLAEQRLELTKGHFFGGEYRGQGAIRLLFRVGWPYLATICIVLYLQSRQTVWRILSVGLVLACYVYIGGDGTRGPVLWSFVSILVAASYYARIRLHTLAWFGTFLLLALVALSLPQKLSKVEAEGGTWKDGVRQLAERIFFGNGINSVYVIEYVRSGHIDLRWGGIHCTDAGAALPFVSSGTPFTYELFLLQNPDAKESRTTLSSMTYLGCLYGDFGWPGAVIGFFLIGAITA